MKRSIYALVMLLLPGVAFAQEKVVPFKLSRTQHIVVRAKIDGKGPFNLVVDTGCPVLLLSTEAAKKAGLDVEKGSAVIGKLEFEGGVALEKVKTRVETPFQIEGMNSMGLPGMELHGMLGYTVLAKYRIAIDLERERMRWTPLDFEPPGFDRLKLKDGGGNIELLGAMLKILSRLSGLKPAPPAEARGMLGLRLETEDGRVKVAQVLEGSPAAEAGLKPGAVIESINGRNVASVEQALRAVAEVRPGDAVTVETKNGDAKASVKIKAASGF